MCSFYTVQWATWQESFRAVLKQQVARIDQTSAQCTLLISGADEH